MRIVSRFYDLIDGHKTHLAVVIIFVASGLKAIGVINEETFVSLMTFGNGLGLFGLRQAKK
ncbi:MAG: hypothetical protein NUV80_04265 [Candidatus Berkelbacteria bacterium]|nr:hypothetical protein [Candidatus Berkelbacteria bacterium]